MKFNELIRWSRQNYSHLPWRVNRSLYGTLVSEIMLQQTTVGTVLNHFERFLHEYPNLETLSAATEEQLLKSWKGLGYYRRARNLKKAAEYFVEKHGGEIPLDFIQLKNAPGIGDYTASALLSIGADLPFISIDANLERVLARVYGVQVEKGPKLLKTLQEKFAKREIGQEIFQVGGREYNEALMDLGRSICQARKASCDICPLKDECYAFKSNVVSEIPKIKVKEKLMHELELLRVIVQKNDKLLGYQKSEHEWLSGQWEIPTFTLRSTDKSLGQYEGVSGEHWYYLPSFKSGITKYKILNYVIHMNEKEFRATFKNNRNYEFIEDNGEFSTASYKALKI